MIKQKVKQIREGKLSAEENIRSFLKKIKQENPKINSILYLNENAIREAKKIDENIKNKKPVGRLAGLGAVIKSNINVDGFVCNCASKVLENYTASYDATVIKKLKQEGAVIIGMANMDEFACGSSGETGAFGVCKNPKVMDRIPGGSSSGSAAAVAAEFCDFALGSDTGGSIRNPASHCGVVGMKPSYGAVSRYGLIDLSMSLDQIGPLARNVEDVELIYEVIKGKDENDASSINYNEIGIKEKIRVGVLNVRADKKILEIVNSKIEEVCARNSWEKQNVEIEHIDLGVQTYYPINYVEFFSGTRKFDGRKYGRIIEESCGEEVLRRILGGREISKAEFAGKYYWRALKAKKVLEFEIRNLFKKFDIIVLPTVPKLPHRLGEKISIEDMYNYDALTVLANLAEIPAISIPVGFVLEQNQKVPVGLQILCDKGLDGFMIEVGKKFQD